MASPAEFPRRRSPVWNVPPRNLFFTGRVRVLAEMHRQLTLPGVDGRMVGVVPLRGMGGVGKTQLATEYAHRYAGENQWVWWVDAESLPSIISGLLDFAAALSLPTAGPPARAVNRLWGVLRVRDNWLLIYDNLEDATIPPDVRPPPNGQLLVTSRNAAVGGYAPTVVEIGEFSRAESMELLRRREPTITPHQADEVAAALGDLPLAVEQAGCFLAQTGLAVPDYLRLLATQPDLAGLDDPTVDRHPGLAAVVSAGRDRLEENDPAARVLLDQMSFRARALAADPRRDDQRVGPGRRGGG